MLEEIPLIFFVPKPHTSPNLRPVKTPNPGRQRLSQPVYYRKLRWDNGLVPTVAAVRRN
jgi:hypothetical protein